MREKFLRSVEPHFAGHESFPLRPNWLPKVVALVRSHPSALMSEEETMIKLGVGKNMARSIRHWGETTSILERWNGGHRISSIGQAIFHDKADPFLERKDTLWLIHYLMVSKGTKNGLWYYLFNIYSNDYLIRQDFAQMVKSWATEHSRKTPSEKTIERDFNCCMSMYARRSQQAEARSISDLIASPLRELRLISGPHENSSYHLRRLTGKEFSAELFAYALIDFWEGQESIETLSVDQILHSEGGPGQIFRMSEDALDYYLGMFEVITNKAYMFDKTAGMQQVLKVSEEDFDKGVFLNALYRQRQGLVAK